MTTKNPYGLTRANRANLLKLADYLDSLPRSYRHFDMENFIAGRNNDDTKVVAYMLKNGGLYNNCGTPGCALGHGPAAGVLARRGVEVVTSPYGYESVDWEQYGYRFIDDETHDYQLVWDFLFSGMWGSLTFYTDSGDLVQYVTKVDDHHHGAAARIRFILAGNEVPEDFDDNNRASMVHAKRLYKEYRK